MLVAIHFLAAEITRFLDWRAGARLPLETVEQALDVDVFGHGLNV